MAYMDYSSGPKVQGVVNPRPAAEKFTFQDANLVRDRIVELRALLQALQDNQAAAELVSRIDAALGGPMWRDTGEYLGAYALLADLQSAHPVGDVDQYALVGVSPSPRTFYVWNTVLDVWEDSGITPDVMRESDYVDPGGAGVVLAARRLSDGSNSFQIETPQIGDPDPFVGYRVRIGNEDGPKIGAAGFQHTFQNGTRSGIVGWGLDLNGLPNFVAGFLDSNPANGESYTLGINEEGLFLFNLSEEQVTPNVYLSLDQQTKRVFLAQAQEALSPSGTPSEGDVIQHGVNGPEWVTPVDIYGVAPSAPDLALLQNGANWDANNTYTGTALAGTYPAGIRVFDGAFLIEYTGTAWHRIAKLGSAGGASALDDLTDVSAASPADGNVLAWDSGAGEWQPVSPASGGAAELNDLSDVVISIANWQLGSGAGGGTTVLPSTYFLVGYRAGHNATISGTPFAVGASALRNSDGSTNCAIGVNAGESMVGNNNLVIGSGAGQGLSLTRTLLMRLGNGDVALQVCTDPGSERFNTVSLPTYADDAAADADSTLPSGAFYKTTGSRSVLQKP